MHVHEHRLIEAILAGADSVAALADVTGAGLGCGTCRFDLLDLIARVRSGSGDRGSRGGTQP